MQSANLIRTTFLDFFRKEGHEVVPSSPLVPRNDPSLLFTNAGMVQFKNVFTGLEDRPYRRAVTAQKCVRAGGKHNDLENVGYTARHHTFFEMLGNFSFGDYFKDRAIELAWRLITQEYGLPKDRLLVTVFSEDDDAYDLWQKIAGLSRDRIIPIATSDNFWAMGDTGPCGPCSEIFYDHGPGIPGGPPGSANADGDRFIEIWNLVFMQYEQVAPEQRVNLPKPSIDTGMGLERLAAILQGQHDNYAVDLLRNLILASADFSHTDPDQEHAVSHRVIADHLRSSGFLIADGVLPSNEGRGYVLRRIMRRAMRHAHKLGVKEPLMWRLVPRLVGEMGAAYPELQRAEALITETLKLEETRFRQTLERGLRLLEEEIDGLSPGSVLPGDVAFRLYDTYGFPLDLTQDILRGQGRAVDLAGFETAMTHQRELARKAWSGSGEAATEAQWFDALQKFGATEFLGYETDRAEARVLALFQAGQMVDAVGPGGESVAIVVNQTPFYAEAGGQQGDTGLLRKGGEAEIRITDTQKKAAELWVHIGKVERGSIAVGDVVELSIDRERREGLRLHHSATHLLHAALRRKLGNHVTQKGSLVTPGKLRFDFSHPRAVTADELRAIEADINRQIRKNSTASIRLMSQQDAMASGALALFGEKYGDEVRVITMGIEEGEGSLQAGGHPYSVELCGGTHISGTGEIGFLKITGEGAIASGVRRIEAVAGKAAEDYVRGEEEILQEVANLLRASRDDITARVLSLIEDRKRLERELTESRKKLLTWSAGAAPDGQVQKIQGISFAKRIVDDIPAKELRIMAESFRQKLGSGVVALAGRADGRASLIVAVTRDLVDRVNAVDLVRAGTAALGGQGGGGKPDMAQSGGPDATRAEAALAAIEKALAEREALSS